MKKSLIRPVKKSFPTTRSAIPRGTGCRKPQPHHRAQELPQPLAHPTLIAPPPSNPPAHFCQGREFFQSGMKDGKIHPSSPARVGTSGLGDSSSGPTNSAGAAADQIYVDSAPSTHGPKPCSPSLPRDGVLIPRSVRSKIIKAFGKATSRCRALENTTHEEPARFGPGKRRRRENRIRGVQTHQRQQQKGREWPVPPATVDGTESWAKTAARERLELAPGRKYCPDKKAQERFAPGGRAQGREVSVP